MATKKRELELLAEGKGCLGKAADDEPVFILRAQDSLAADIVRLWAKEALALGCPVEKAAEALDLADKMDRWPVKKDPD